MSGKSKRNKNQLSKTPPQKDQTADVPTPVVHHVEMSSGPMPHPEVLEAYNQLVPGAAERILVTFEKETEHRQSLERKTLDAQVEDAKADRSERRLGQIFAFLIGVVAISWGGIAAIKGAEITGGFIGVGGVAALVWVFIRGQTYKQQDQS